MNGTNTGTGTCGQSSAACAVHGPSWAWHNERYVQADAINATPMTAAEAAAALREHAAEADEAAAANVPLYVQERLLEAEFAVIVRQLAMWLDECEDPEGADLNDDLHDLCLSRLRSGFKSYGSAMYEWTPERRRREVLEEIADAVVYLSAGPIE